MNRKPKSDFLLCTIWGFCSNAALISVHSNNEKSQLIYNITIMFNVRLFLLIVLQKINNLNVSQEIEVFKLLKKINLLYSENFIANMLVL